MGKRFAQRTGKVSKGISFCRRRPDAAGVTKATLQHACETAKSRTVRILLVHNSADIYGASRSLARLVSRLDRARFTPLVLLPEDGPLRGMLESAGGRVFIQPSLRVITRQIFKSPKILGFLAGFVFSARKTAALIRRERISLVHTNTGVVVSAALAAKFAGVPHVWHIRDWFQEFGPLWGPYSRYILAFSSRVLCVSQPIADQFAPSPKISVLNNGFDLAEFPPVSPEEKTAARNRFGFAPDDFVVGTVGRIKFVRKGQEFLLRAVALLQAKNIKCLLVGGSPPGAEDQLERMKALAVELGVTDQVVFTGELADPRPAYAAMNAFVLPSAQPEPFGGVVMEAMCLGLPVVGTAIGGTTEQVAEGETGFLVPPADPEALANAIARIAGDPALGTQMGISARGRVASRFSLDQMVGQIESIYSGCRP